MKHEEASKPTENAEYTC